MVGEDPTAQARRAMVHLLERRGVKDRRVLEAMGTIPRHRLVPAPWQSQAYDDRPLPIGKGQTISQPYIVGFMSEAAAVQPGHKVLEIGTGSGYQAAVLAAMGARVYSIEIVEELSREAARNLKVLGVEGVQLRVGDGYAGWPEEAPFNAIVVTAAPPKVPGPLLDQLAENGRLVIPVGEAGAVQTMEVHIREGQGFRVERPFAVRFVPMTGKAQE